MSRLKVPRQAPPELIECARRQRAVLRKLTEFEGQLRSLGAYEDALSPVPAGVVRQLVQEIRVLLQ